MSFGQLKKSIHETHFQEAKEKINTTAQGRDEIKLTFYKETRSIKNLAKKYQDLKG